MLSSPPDPPPPFSRMEIFAAKFADTTLGAALACRAAFAAIYETDRRIAADRAGQLRQTRDRFAACRAWVRRHPEA